MNRPEIVSGRGMMDQRGLGKGQSREPIDRERRGSGHGMDDELYVVGRKGAGLKYGQSKITDKISPK